MPKKPCPRRAFPRPTAFCIQLEIITWQHAYSMRMTKWSFWGHAKNDHTSRCHSDRPIHGPGCHMHFKDLTQLNLYQWGFILSFTGKLKICTCIAERYKNIPNWYGHRPILHGSCADKFNAVLANARYNTMAYTGRIDKISIYRETLDGRKYRQLNVRTYITDKFKTSLPIVQYNRSTNNFQIVLSTEYNGCMSTLYTAQVDTMYSHRPMWVAFSSRFGVIWT